MLSARLIVGIRARKTVEITYCGQKVQALEGESITSALMRSGTATAGMPHHGLEVQSGYYCGMGICWECAVRIDDGSVVRGCCSAVRDGLVVDVPAVASLDDQQS